MTERWDLANEYLRLRESAEKARFALRAYDQQTARAKLVRLPPHQRIVLGSLVAGEDYSDETWCQYLRNIIKSTGLTRTQVRRALGALRKLGFVEFHRGLFNDDGDVAGSGYCISKVGHEWWWAKEHEAEVERCLRTSLRTSPTAG